MKRPINVNTHLSADQLEARYRKAKDPVESSHWQIIWLLAHRKTPAEIAEVSVYCLSWMRTIAHRYNQQSPQGLGDRRHDNPGGTFILSPEQ